MRLVIIRHAKAEKQSSTGRDADRLITTRGERQACFIAGLLASDSPRPDLILSSGILRAVQTARIIQEALGATLRIEPALETGSTESAAIALVEARMRAEPARGVLVVVGHNPTLENVVSLLASGASGGGVSLRTGECAILEAPAGGDHSLAGACRVVESRRLDDEND